MAQKTSKRVATRTTPLAPADEVRRVLREKRRELDAAEAELAEAEGRFDATAASEAAQRIAMLRRFVATLTARAADAVEDDGRARAREWLAKHEERVAQARREINEVQQRVQVALAGLLDAIKVEAQIRKGIEASIVGADVLARRFGLDTDPARVALPALTDWATPVLNAADQMRPSRVARRGIVVATTASATPEQVRRETLRVVAAWLAQHTASLPEDVQRILADAPIPESVIAGPAKKAPSEHEQREAARIMRDKQEMERALASAPGSVMGGL